MGLVNMSQNHPPKPVLSVALTVLQQKGQGLNRPLGSKFQRSSLPGQSKVPRRALALQLLAIHMLCR